jgi:hypothetical protein
MLWRHEARKNLEVESKGAEALAKWLWWADVDHGRLDFTEGLFLATLKSEGTPIYEILPQWERGRRPPHVIGHTGYTSIIAFSMTVRYPVLKKRDCLQYALPLYLFPISWNPPDIYE